jgi:hypothetical protein
MKDLVLRLLLLRNDIVTCPLQIGLRSKMRYDERIETELMERLSHIATTACISQETITVNSLESQYSTLAGLFQDSQGEGCCEPALLTRRVG